VEPLAGGLGALQVQHSSFAELLCGQDTGVKGLRGVCASAACCPALCSVHGRAVDVTFGGMTKYVAGLHLQGDICILMYLCVRARGKLALWGCSMPLVAALVEQYMLCCRLEQQVVQVAAVCHSVMSKDSHTPVPFDGGQATKFPGDYLGVVWGLA